MMRQRVHVAAAPEIDNGLDTSVTACPEIRGVIDDILGKQLVRARKFAFVDDVAIEVDQVGDGDDVLGHNALSLLRYGPCREAIARSAPHPLPPGDSRSPERCWYERDQPM